MTKWGTLCEKLSLLLPSWDLVSCLQRRRCRKRCYRLYTCRPSSRSLRRRSTPGLQMVLGLPDAASGRWKIILTVPQILSGP